MAAGFDFPLATSLIFFSAGAVLRRRAQVAVMGGNRKGGYLQTKLRVTSGDKERIVMHFWYDTWPDHGVPTDRPLVISMLQDVRTWSPPGHPWCGPA